jgi:hypothetical protein
LLEVAFDSSPQIFTIPNAEVHRIVHAIRDILSLVLHEDVMNQEAMCTHPTTEFHPMTDIHYFQVLYWLDTVLTEEIFV